MPLRVGRFLFSGNLFLLLFTLLGLLFIYPFLPDEVGSVRIMDLFVTTILVSAVFTLSHRPLIRWLCLIVLFIELGLNAAVYWFGMEGLHIMHLATVIVFFGITGGTILTGVFRAERVTGQMVAGAVVVYLMMALVWANFYTILEIAAPGSLNLHAHQAAIDAGTWSRSSMMIYYSIVTITTLGYGDIRPATEVAAALSSTEALVGQLFLTVMIARLVGLHISQGRRSRISRHAPGDRDQTRCKDAIV